jgi:putative ABC transport system ATP-binding protein
MMNILGCLDIPTYGDYVLNGELVSELEDTELSRIRNREIGFIFQGFNLIPELTAIENVELPILYSGIKGSRRELAMDALRRVGLEDRARHRPSEMSGGQQQRVAIARALTTKPPIILADEPTGNLDSKNGEQVMEILRELHSEGSTVVLITHDGTIARMADRIIRLLDGKIVFDSKFDEGDPFSEEVLHVSASGI